MSALTDLIAKLETAPEGSRKLDAEVWAAILPTGPTNPLPHDNMLLDLRDDLRREYVPTESGLVEFWATDAYGRRVGLMSDVRKAPAFTTSLDAALTLVTEPEPVAWIVSEKDPDDLDPRPLATVMPRHGRGWSNGRAATPPLAVCIAALRAREAMDA